VRVISSFSFTDTAISTDEFQAILNLRTPPNDDPNPLLSRDKVHLILTNLEVRADAVCSAAACRPSFIGGGSAPFNFCQRRRRKIFSGAPAVARRPETPHPDFKRLAHYILTILLVKVCLLLNI
jgi:hypothetical protein